MGILRRRRASALGAAALVSIGAHVALVVAATSLPTADAAEAVVVDVVEIVDIVAPPDEPANAPAPPPPAPAAAKPRAAPRTLVATAPKPAPEPEAAPSAPADDTPAEPSAPVVAAATGGPAGDVTGAAPGGVPGGLPGGLPGGTGTRPPINEERRKHLFASYRQQMRGRIGAGFRYPPEARELELSGEVVVEVSVGRGGELRRVRLRGSCPHALLCDDALRTVRAAAPFAPLPPDLAGDPVQIDVPLNYAFE